MKKIYFLLSSLLICFFSYSQSPNQEDIITTQNLVNSSQNTESFSIYPNPTKTGFVNIKTNSNKTIKVTIYDVLGKQIISQTVNNKRLNVSNLNAGIYVLKLTQNGNSTTKKLVVE